MGVRTQEIFAEAEALGGLAAKARLASLARVTSTEAAASDDTSGDLVARLRSALGIVRGEYAARVAKRAESGPVPVAVPLPSTGDDPAGLRRQIGVFVDLMSQRGLLLRDLAATARRVNEAAALTLGVSRVSVWLLTPDHGSISCLDLYESERREHTSGARLAAADFPEYFAALTTERTIAANDAHTDPRTACFSKVYLTPLRIGAMLDVPIWDGERMAGVICHEHVGGSRTWTGDEERFAYLMSGFMALAMERAGR
jgi:hypothetical protein